MAKIGRVDLHVCREAGSGQVAITRTALASAGTRRCDSAAASRSRSVLDSLGHWITAANGMGTASRTVLPRRAPTTRPLGVFYGLACGVSGVLWIAIAVALTVGTAGRGYRSPPVGGGAPPPSARSLEHQNNGD
jgi:hypothetical protein